MAKYRYQPSGAMVDVVRTVLTDLPHHKGFAYVEQTCYRQPIALHLLEPVTCDLSIDTFLDKDNRMATIINTALLEIEASNYTDDTGWPAAAYDPNVINLPSELMPLFRPPPYYEFWTLPGEGGAGLKKKAQAIIDHNTEQLRMTLTKLDMALGGTKPYAF